MERCELAPGYEISRVIRGGWQLAGGHGAIGEADAIEDLIATADAGITTFDCADIYTGVESIMGAFRTAYRDRRGSQALNRVRIHTKFVPDLDRLPTLSRADVSQAIDRSLEWLGMERLDLVQFHWWDYDVPGCVDVAGWLVDLQDAGKIDRIGATNFNTEQAVRLIASGVPLSAMQVQYSLIDDRPARALAGLAARHGFGLLCYGTVAGGFLSDRWLGQPEPMPPFENRSLAKYKLIIDDAGGWEAHQRLLGVLRAVADRHGSDIATVAGRYLLDLPGVAGIIVGARNRRHLAANIAVSELRLDADDRAAICQVTAQRPPLHGDVYDLERDRPGRHGAVMKYNLNAAAAG